MELTKRVEEKEELLTKIGIELNECQSQLKEKDNKILELEEEKTQLNKECEELLSWGRSLNKDNSQFCDRIADLMKQIAETKTKLFYSLSERILFLASIVIPHCFFAHMPICFCLTIFVCFCRLMRVNRSHVFVIK